MRVARGENTIWPNYGEEFHIARQQNSLQLFDLSSGVVFVLILCEAQSQTNSGIFEWSEFLHPSKERGSENHMARPQIVFTQVGEHGCNHPPCCNMRLKSWLIVTQSAIMSCTHYHLLQLQPLMHSNLAVPTDRGLGRRAYGILMHPLATDAISEPCQLSTSDNFMILCQGHSEPHCASIARQVQL
jgi:hypothetical protein